MEVESCVVFIVALTNQKKAQWFSQSEIVVPQTRDGSIPKISSPGSGHELCRDKWPMSENGGQFSPESLPFIKTDWFQENKPVIKLIYLIIRADTTGSELAISQSEDSKVNTAE